MPVNQYFNNFNNANEQSLIEDLVIESIKMYGLDTWYSPRNIRNRDAVQREADYTTFDNAISVEMYVRSQSGYGGDGKFMSMIGVEVRDEITFSVAIKSFNKEVTSQHSDIIRPREGDIIYFAPAQEAYQITYVNREAVFYQLGSVQFYDITCELFEYNNEVFQTGISDLDARYTPLSTDVDGFHVLSAEGDTLVDQSGHGLIEAEYDIDDLDPGAQNTDLHKEAGKIMDWNETDPFSEGHY